MKEKNVAIILAGGKGERFNKEEILPKQFIKISGKTVMEHTIEKFENNKNIHEIIIVINPDYIKLCRSIVRKNNFKKITSILKGGKSRQESSRIGLYKCNKKTTKVLFHDAVRPFLNQRIIDDTIKALNKFESVDVAIPSSDTLIKTSPRNTIIEIPNRKYFMRGQTPQGFRYKLIYNAHKIAERERNTDFTDDCGLIEYYGLAKTYVVLGSEENIKITYPLDIHIADKLFQIKNERIENNINLNKLENKNVIIFGHSSGIGKKVYMLCKKYKANVVGFSKSTGLDICNSEEVKYQIKKYIKENGKIDYLVSTAGILMRNEIHKFTQDEILTQITINYIAQINIVKQSIPFMKKNGSIALFASSSYTRGRATYSIYSSTKAAVVNFVQAISEELAPKKIKINAICPARTNTPMRRKNFKNEAKNTLLDPETVAKITLKTCLSEITGQVIDIRLIK